MIPPISERNVEQDNKAGELDGTGEVLGIGHRLGRPRP
jgi:hypothetical protein